MFNTDIQFYLNMLVTQLTFNSLFNAKIELFVFLIEIFFYYYFAQLRLNSNQISFSLGELRYAK